MNNLDSLVQVVNTMNYKTFPSVFDVLNHINLHIGEYKWSSRADDFNGWLKCDGRSLHREEYADLFDIIGTSFGSDSPTTFKLPDLRGRVMGCVGTGTGLTARTMGATVGEETHVLTTAEMPSHSHTATAASAGSHNHTGNTGNDGSHTHTVNDPGHAHTQSTVNDDYNNSGGNPPSFAADGAGSATWNNISTATTGITINASGVHSHSIALDGSHTHTISVTSMGGGSAHNNMQPTCFAAQVFIFGGYNPTVVPTN